MLAPLPPRCRFVPRVRRCVGPAGVAALAGLLAASCSVELNRFSDAGPSGAGACAPDRVADEDVLSDNLLANPSLEQDASGWVGWNATPARRSAEDAPHGNYVAHVETTGSHAQYSIDDQPDAVESVPANATYRATACVRSDAPASNGKPVTLNLRERTSEGAQVSLWSSADASLSTTFRKLVVSGASPREGNTLELYILQGDAGDGDAFVADAIVLTQNR